jgi:predicted DNA binding CopG/RHH family protein
LRGIPAEGVTENAEGGCRQGKAFPHKELDYQPKRLYDFKVTSKWNQAMAERNGEKSRIPVTIRVPETILKEIDNLVEQEALPISRNHWIVEALVDKLKKNHNGN